MKCPKANVSPEIKAMSLLSAAMLLETVLKKPNKHVKMVYDQYISSHLIFSPTFLKVAVDQAMDLRALSA